MAVQRIVNQPLYDENIIVWYLQTSTEESLYLVFEQQPERNSNHILPSVHDHQQQRVYCGWPKHWQQTDMGSHCDGYRTTVQNKTGQRYTTSIVLVHPFPLTTARRTAHGRGPGPAAVRLHNYQQGLIPPVGMIETTRELWDCLYIDLLQAEQCSSYPLEKLRECLNGIRPWPDASLLQHPEATSSLSETLLQPRHQ